MTAADESENLLVYLTERAGPDGRRVIGNPTRRPDPGSDESKTWVRTTRKGRRPPGGPKAGEADTPGAA